MKDQLHFKGTHGEWVVANNGHDINTADEYFNEIATAMNKHDAKLIATAPELLRCLKAIVASYKAGLIKIDDGCVHFGYAEQGFKNAEEIIKKALL